MMNFKINDKILKVALFFNIAFVAIFFICWFLFSWAKFDMPLIAFATIYFAGNSYFQYWFYKNNNKILKEIIPFSLVIIFIFFQLQRDNSKYLFIAITFALLLISFLVTGFTTKAKVK